MSIPAGWFPDESNPGRDRYWDGLKWTDEIRDSVGGGPKPPSPQDTTSPDASNETLLLKMTEPEFLIAVNHLSDRPLTHPALVTFHRVEKQLCGRAQLLAEFSRSLRTTQMGSEYGAMKAAIATFESFYTTTYTPTVEALGVAMTTDFNALVKENGGPTLLPVPFDQAWEKYSRPVKALVERMDEERRSYLELFERIRDQHLP